jgi:hypothetical protein
VTFLANLLPDVRASKHFFTSPGQFLPVLSDDLVLFKKTNVMFSFILRSEIMQTKNRRLRERKQIFLLEGLRHIQDAVDAGVKIVSLYFAKGELLRNFPLEEMVADGTELYKVKMGHMQLWTDLVKASGIMGKFQNI